MTIGIINPPYSIYDPDQQANRLGGAGNGSKYHLFCSKLINETSESVHLTPDGWMINPNLEPYRKKLLNNGLKQIFLVSRKVFANAKLMGDVVIYHLVDGYEGDVTVTDANKSFSISRNDIAALGFIPQANVDIHRVAIGRECMDTLYNKGKNETTPLVGDRSLAYSDILQPEQSVQTPHKMVSRLGGSFENNEILYVAKASPAIDTDKVCVTSLSTERKLTYLQFVPKGTDVSGRILYFPVSSPAEGERLMEYLESSFVRTIVAGIKVLSYNSKSVMSRIPLPMTPPHFERDHISWMMWDDLTYGGEHLREATRQKITSEVFTPDQVAAFMVSLIEGDDTVYDPCCGDGQLLAAAQDAGYTVTGNDVMEDNRIYAASRLGVEIDQINYLAEPAASLDAFF